MNIFYLSDDPKTCAAEHINKHVVKMITEHTQLMSTAYRLRYGIKTAVKQNGRTIQKYVLSNSLEDELFKATHVGNPLQQWLNVSYDNYMWLYELNAYLNEEYKLRYDHTQNHKSFDKMLRIPKMSINEFKTVKRTKALSHMKDEYKISENPIINYRNLYLTEKRSFATWTCRPTPIWFEKSDPLWKIA